MTQGLLRKAIALLLVVTVVAMGFVAAAARGQTRAGGAALVLCTGGGLVQITLDASGAPTGATHLCPDLAVTLLAALDLPPPGAGAPLVLPAAADLPAADALPDPVAPARPQARGPPSGI